MLFRSPEASAPDPGPILDDDLLLRDICQLLGQLFLNERTPAAEEPPNLPAGGLLPYFARQLEEAGLLPEDDGIQHLRCLLNVYKANLQMHYLPLPKISQPLPIALFRASEAPDDPSPVEEFGADAGWGRYSDQAVRINHVPGNHLTMMRPPHVGWLAQLMEKELGQGANTEIAR